MALPLKRNYDKLLTKTKEGRNTAKFINDMITNIFFVLQGNPCVKQFSPGTNPGKRKVQVSDPQIVTTVVQLPFSSPVRIVALYTHTLTITSQCKQGGLGGAIIYSKSYVDGVDAEKVGVFAIFPLDWS
jgi:hypothetical protein